MEFIVNFKTILMDYKRDRDGELINAAADVMTKIIINISICIHVII